MAIPALKYITPQEYLEMEAHADEKHEYFDGKVIAMSGTKEAHSRIVVNLIGEIGGFLKGKACDVFPSDLRIATPSSNSYMYPDVSIVCGDIEKKDGEFDTCVNPSVIIEVMSESTRDKDRGYKYFYYQQIQSVKEYILVDSAGYFVQSVYKQPDDSWKFGTTEDINMSLNIHTIGLSLPLNDIYYRMVFM